MSPYQPPSCHPIDTAEKRWQAAQSSGSSSRIYEKSKKHTLEKIQLIDKQNMWKLKIWWVGNGASQKTNGAQINGDKNTWRQTVRSLFFEMVSIPYLWNLSKAFWSGANAISFRSWQHCECFKYFMSNLVFRAEQDSCPLKIWWTTLNTTIDLQGQIFIYRQWCTCIVVFP